MAGRATCANAFYFEELQNQQSDCCITVLIVCIAFQNTNYLFTVAYLGFCKGGPNPGVWGDRSPPAGSGVEPQSPAVFCDFETNSKHFEAPFNG